ncbi:LysR family transcriptional regulator [Aeromicrobium sp.]|uniref:LysR family transcriptional regulator n=1 Tax=Aeromicrobium sp. TaxID=1871063 RepID=UPI0028A83AF7|nr:LysR family transcriptional regulator [Aeromicrobium sp.]
MRLRHLEYFVAVAEHGSIAAAANELYVAASGVSQTVAELESLLGARLFERSRSGSRPTAAGQTMLGPARRALEAFAAATSFDGESIDGPHSLSVLSTPSLVLEPTSTLLGELNRRLPGVRIDLTEPTGAFVSDAVQPVLAGTVDVAITEHPEAPIVGTRIVRMRDQDTLLVCPPGTPAPPDGTFTSSDLLNIGLVVAPLFESSAVCAQLQAVEPRVTQAIVMRSEHRDAFLTLARAGAGAVLLERRRAERAATLGCVIGELAELPPRRISAVARADRGSPALEAFLDLCSEGRSEVAGQERDTTDLV